MGSSNPFPKMPIPPRCNKCKEYSINIYKIGLTTFCSRCVEEIGKDKLRKLYETSFKQAEIMNKYLSATRGFRYLLMNKAEQFFLEKLNLKKIF